MGRAEPGTGRRGDTVTERAKGRAGEGASGQRDAGKRCNVETCWVMAPLLMI